MVRPEGFYKTVGEKHEPYGNVCKANPVCHDRQELQTGFKSPGLNTKNLGIIPRFCKYARRLCRAKAD